MALSKADLDRLTREVISGLLQTYDPGDADSSTSTTIRAYIDACPAGRELAGKPKRDVVDKVQAMLKTLGGGPPSSSATGAVEAWQRVYAAAKRGDVGVKRALDFLRGVSSVSAILPSNDANNLPAIS